MQHVWLYSVCQCVLSVSVIGVSVRLCMAGRAEGARGASVSACLRLCLGWVGALGGAVGVPVSVLLNLRSPQCLYACITLVCCPLLVRQFTICLLLLLTLNAHLQHRLGDRHAAIVTRRRALCLVMLSWVLSVLTSFAQFIGRDVVDTWGGSDGSGLAGLGGGQGVNWTTPVPPPKHPYPQDRSVIGQYLPYGGFLSKFLVEDMHNFTYAEIHGSHWGVCAPDAVLSPGFLVYVHGVAAFAVPLLLLLAVYLDLMCAPAGLPPKRSSARARSLALSLSLLVLLCLPLHTTHALLLFAPGSTQPVWASMLTSLLFQGYGLVPPLLFTHANQRVGSEGTPLPLPHLPTAAGKGVGRALCTTVQDCYPSGSTQNAKVSPDSEV